MQNTQLTDLNTYNFDNIIFSPVQEVKLNGGITFKRIYISTQNPDGSSGELVFSTPEVTTFGIKEIQNQKTKLLDGYALPLYLYTRQNVTTEEKKFVENVTNLSEYVKDYMWQNRIPHKNGWITDKFQLKKLNPIYYPSNKETGEENLESPSLFLKLKTSYKMSDDGHKEDFNVTTSFYNQETAERIANPLTLVGRQCRTTAIVKVECIFMGLGKCILQCKAYQVAVKINSCNGEKMLLSLAAPVPSSSQMVSRKVVHDSEPSLLSFQGASKEVSNGNYSNNEDEDEEEEEETVPSQSVQPVVVQPVSTSSYTVRKGPTAPSKVVKRKV
jgi:hypothetical protein